MGWAYGTNAAGREIGYSVDAECDQDGCTTSIDRGLDYVCGGMHDGGEHGCGGYFCHEHLGYRIADDGGPRLARDPDGDRYPQLCPGCLARIEDDSA